MALFSNFCNICYKSDNASLKDISEENMKHLSDTLITFVGNADIIKHNGIYLCQLCCEELTRFDKFRDMCFRNLIQLRQRYINKKLELQCAVQNTLQQFVFEEVLRKSSLEKSICPVSISTDCHAIIKSPADLNNDCLVFNRQVTNLQLETDECEFGGACSEVSVVNSVTECDESRVAITNEENMKNEILRCTGNTNLEEFEVEADEIFNVSDTNIDNESDSSQMEFMKEEFDMKNERESNDTETLTLTNFENDPDEHANFDANVPVINNFEGNVNSLSESTKEDCGKEFIRSGESKAGMKFRSRGRINKLTAATIDAQFNRPHVREYRNRRSAKALQSGAHDRVYPSVEAHICAVCNKSFRTSSCLTRHAHIHNGDRPYKCTVCDKTFTHSSSLTTHERIHSGDRPYKCTICYKTFTQLGSLTAHERIHSGARPYKCSVCNKTFIQLAHLNTHERLHSGARPYRSRVCRKTFTHLST